MKRGLTILIGICLGLGVATTAPLWADVILLKEKDKDGNPKRISGTVVGSQGVGDRVAVIIESKGQKRTILKSKIEAIEPSIDEGELQNLDPRDPEKYFELGLKYAKQSDDAEACSCALHLLKAAIELDPGRFAVPAHAKIAEIADREEQTLHLVEILRLDPGNSWALGELRELHSARLDSGDLSPLVQSIGAALKSGQLAPVLAFAKHLESKALFDRLAPASPQVYEQLRSVPVEQDCPACNGTTRVKCQNCRGGRLQCSECGGRGLIHTTASSTFVSPTREGTLMERSAPVSVRCPNCKGQKTFDCPKCDAGWIPCKACSGKQSNKTMDPRLRAKLTELHALLSTPPGESWARELLVEDRSPFRGLASPNTFGSPNGVDGRYYRAGGEWRTKP